MEPTEAGQGQYHAYALQGAFRDDIAFTKDTHYIAVDAASWYLNKQGSFWTDRTASGTLEIALYNELEVYKVPLGNFELAAGATIAPVFDAPVLPDRYYRGAPVTLRATLLSFKKDAAITAMLKGAADAGLGIVKSMVDTATKEGPSRILGAAGGSLFDGVSKLLAAADKRETIFDPGTPLTKGLQERDLFGPEMFVLLHRGAELDTKKLRIATQDGTTVPLYNEKLLRDGAWLLVRIRRSDRYTGVRPWDRDERTLKQSISFVAQDFQHGAITKEQALAKLKPAADGQTTLWSEFEKLKVLIAGDPVLTSSDVTTRVAALYGAFKAAKAAVEKPDSVATFAATITELRDSLGRGAQPFDEGLLANITEVVKMRNPALLKPAETSSRMLTGLKDVRSGLDASFQLTPKGLFAGVGD